MKSKLHLQENWKGVWTALITPFEKKGGQFSIDKKSLASLIERQIADGIHGFIIAGSTGEGSLLSPALYADLLKASSKIISKRAYWVAGLGIGGTQSCLHHIEIAKKLGANGVLASPPAYIKTPPRLLKEHYLKLATQGLPLCLYEIPGRAASSMSVEFIQDLVSEKKAKNIVALKDATGDIERLSKEAIAFGNRLALLSGDDGTFAPFMKNGGHGIISVASHFLAKDFKAILEYSLSLDWKKAEELQARASKIIDLLFIESNPIPAKSLAAKLKWIRKALFLPPLAPMDPKLLEKLSIEFSHHQAPKDEK